MVRPPSFDCQLLHLLPIGILKMEVSSSVIMAMGRNVLETSGGEDAQGREDIDDA